MVLSCNYCEVIQVSTPWTSSPTLPWGHVRFTVIHDRLLSGIWSGTLQSHREYWLYHFYPRSENQQGAKVGILQVAQTQMNKITQWPQAHTHVHTRKFLTPHAGITGKTLKYCIRVRRQQADCSGFCVFTWYKNSNQIFYCSLQLWVLSVQAITFVSELVWEPNIL